MMRRHRRLGALVTALLCLPWALAAPAARGTPTSEEVQAQIAQFEASYAQLAAAVNDNARQVAQAQADLDATSTQVVVAQADLAQAQARVTQIALTQLQDRDLSQSFLLLTSPDSATLLQRLTTVSQVDYQVENLVIQLTQRQADLARLQSTREAAVATLAQRGPELEAQMADLKAKEAEARNLLATVVSPRNVGDNGGLTAHAITVKQTLAGVFPQITNIGGYRAGDWGEHGQGRALDVMIPNPSSAAGVELGDSIARWCQDNALTLGVQYLIWRQRYWQAGWGPNSWQWMADRGSPTQNHYDHVHISLKS